MMDPEGSSVPVLSLCLLAPPLRLMSAAMWKTILQRDVSQYGRLEEFITNTSQSVPGLLDYRHYVKLVLGLRSRLILELCRDPEALDTTAILTHLERLPALVQAAPNKPKRDLKVEMTLSNFQNLIRTLLEDSEERDLFFQEEFPEQYGTQYDKALEKLMWEFLTRLDQLLPVPDLAQTVSWLGSSPTVLDECAKSATPPQLLRNMLQHELLLGHAGSGLSLPPTTGDEVFSTSLPPSGRLRETHQPGSNQIAGSSVPSPPKSNQQEQRETGPPIDPVIGSILLKDIKSATAGAQLGDKSCQPEGQLHDDVEPDASAQNFTKIRQKTCSRPAKAAGNVEEHIGRKYDPVRVPAQDEVRAPRKRGRPRRLKDVKSVVVGAKLGEKSSPSDIQSHRDAEADSASAPNLPRRRGRPRKREKCDMAVTEGRKEKKGQENVGGEAVAGAKLGEKSSPSDIQSHRDVEADSASAPNLPRRRGRPRKREKCDMAVTEGRKEKKGQENVGDEAAFTSAATGGRRNRTALLSSCLKRQPRVVLRRVDVMEVAEQRGDGVALSGHVDVATQKDNGVAEITQTRDELASLLSSCARRQLRIVIQRLDVSSPAVQALLNGPPAATTEHEKPLSRMKKSHVTRRKRKRAGLASPEKTLLDSENKENIDGLQIISQRTNSPGKVPSPSVSEEEIVADSEDESSNSFKLFLKRYYKTRHNTLVPTLEEFVKPGLGRRDLSPGTRQRQ